MTIFYQIGDLKFNSSNLDDLKKELEEYFSYKGLTPTVEIQSDCVRVDIDEDKIKTAEAKVKLAYDCCNIGNFTSAKKYLSGALEICPLYSEAYRTLAQIYMQEGKYEEAMSNCGEAIKCDPRNMWAHILMGNILLHNKKDPKGALTYYEKALQYHPDNAIALNNVAGVKLSLGEFGGAISIFDQVLQKDNTYANAHYGKAAALKNMGSLEDALEAARIGCIQGKKTPENPDVMRRLVQLQVSIARQIAEKTDYMVDAGMIKDEIEKEFGVPVEFRADPGMPVLGKLRYGRHYSQNRNIVFYNPGKPFTAHYVIHELMHLYMFSRNTKAGVGKMVTSDGGGQNPVLQQILFPTPSLEGPSGRTSLR